MRKVAKLRDRLTSTQRQKRAVRITLRSIGEYDRDVQKWADERKIDQRFREARRTGRVTGGRKASDASRLAALGLTGV